MQSKFGSSPADSFLYVGNKRRYRSIPYFYIFLFREILFYCFLSSYQKESPFCSCYYVQSKGQKKVTAVVVALCSVGQRPKQQQQQPRLEVLFYSHARRLERYRRWQRAAAAAHTSPASRTTATRRGGLSRPPKSGHCVLVH